MCTELNRDRSTMGNPMPLDLEAVKGMKFIDPHIHMVSRTTDDYQNLFDAGVSAVIEPAFWVRQPRTGLDTFKDYYSSLIGWERFRASQFGIRHFCTIGLNSREANNEPLAEQVMEILPHFLFKEGVLGIGEIGFDDQTVAEEKFYRAQLELAKESEVPVQVHTPHRDKTKGTTRSMDIALEHGLSAEAVIIDHNTEETVKEVLDRGFWAAFTIYPFTKMGNERMVEIVKQYGAERILINSGRPSAAACPRRRWGSRCARHTRPGTRGRRPSRWPGAVRRTPCRSSRVPSPGGGTARRRRTRAKRARCDRRRHRLGVRRTDRPAWCADERSPASSTATSGSFPVAGDGCVPSRSVPAGRKRSRATPPAPHVPRARGGSPTNRRRVARQGAHRGRPGPSTRRCGPRSAQVRANRGPATPGETA